MEFPLVGERTDVRTPQGGIFMRKGGGSMKAKVSHRKRYNLYYIFAQDQKAHPMPEGRTERVRQKLLQIFAAKQKPRK